MPNTIRRTESEIIKGCLANDRYAQKELYDRYKTAMFTLAYRITGDFPAAEEVLQDTFLKVFRGLAGFRSESTLGAWIKTILVRTAYTKIKKQVQFDPIEYANPSSFQEWGHTLDSEYLEKAILDLPEGYRTVFVMIEIEGYAHREVAEILNISEGTSKSQLFHAKRRLRENLEKYS